MSVAAVSLPQWPCARPQPCRAGPRSHAAPWLVHAAKPARAAPQWHRRRPLVVCQAVEERVDLAKVADEPGVGLGTVFSPYTLAPLALGEARRSRLEIRQSKASRLGLRWARLRVQHRCFCWRARCPSPGGGTRCCCPSRGSWRSAPKSSSSRHAALMLGVCLLLEKQLATRSSAPVWWPQSAACALGQQYMKCQHAFGHITCSGHNMSYLFPTSVLQYKHTY